MTTDVVWNERYWRPPPDLTFDGWAHLGETFLTMERAIKWWIGDWWIFGQERFPDEIPQFIDAALERFTYATIQDAERVCRAIPPEERVTGVSFTHHRRVITLPPRSRTELLTKAANEQMSADDLRKEVRRYNGGGPVKGEPVAEQRQDPSPVPEQARRAAVVAMAEAMWAPDAVPDWNTAVRAAEAAWEALQVGPGGRWRVRALEADAG